MRLKDSILPQRARLAYWSPLVALLLVGLLNVTPFASLDSSVTSDGEEENMISTDFYPREYVDTQPFTEDYEDTGVFGEQSTERLPYGNSGDYYGEIGEIGEELSTLITVITTLSVIMLIVGFSSRNNRLDANRFMNGKTLAGIGLAIIALFSVLITSTILQDFADVQNNQFEEFWDGDVEDPNLGAWGEISKTLDDEMETQFTISWAPNAMFWISVLLVLAAGVGAASNLSYLRYEAVNDERPVWSDEKGPNWFQLDWTKAALGAMALAGMVALFAPWYQVDQEWFVVEYNENGGYTNSTHELAWTMTPFAVSLTNDTGLFDEGEGEQSTERSSYSERYELAETSPIFMGLRAPLVCIGLLTLAWIAFQATNQTAERIGGNKEHWSLILMSMVMAIVLLSNLSSFEKD
ncbi:MAG TPA: hypothetical protein QGI72_01390, partial [Poseidonia sp.]|nr:hypothetical protein [Poseidonia sp.]